MAFTTAQKNSAVDALTGGAGGAKKYLSLHSADPGATGASEIAGGSPAYARKPTTWPAASAGSATGSQVTFDVASGATITHWGCWDAATLGNFLEGGTLSASETYGSQGTYLFTPTVSAA